MDQDQAQDQAGEQDGASTPPRRSGRSRLVVRALAAIAAVAVVLAGVLFVRAFLVALPGGTTSGPTASSSRRDSAITGPDGPTGSTPGAAIPGVSRAAAEQKLRALGVSVDRMSGYEIGQAADSASGVTAHVALYLGPGDDQVAGVGCVFLSFTKVTVDPPLVDRAIRCATSVVPAADQASVSDWLTANATVVHSASSPRRDEFGGLLVTVERSEMSFSVIVVERSAPSTR